MDDRVNPAKELTQLDKTIKNKLAHCKSYIEEWREDIEVLSISLARARDLHPSDTAFGHWCTTQFGENLKKNERAILVRWGRDPDATYALLRSTTSFSIQMIDQRARFPEMAAADVAADVSEPDAPPPEQVKEDTTAADRPAHKAQADAEAKAAEAGSEAQDDAAHRARAQAKARAEERAEDRAWSVHEGHAQPYATLFLTKQDFSILMFALSEEQTSPERRLEAFKLVNAFRDRNRQKK